MCIRKDNGRLIVCLDNSKKEVLLRITIDNNLNFDSHIKRMCPKSVPKQSGLFRIPRYFGMDEKELLFISTAKS